jgi:hypothetical protein
MAMVAAWLLATVPGAAAVLCDRAFMVRNATDLALSNVLATVSLADLGVPREQDVQARGVAILEGPDVPCQLDPFASVQPELSSEISLLLDLGPRGAARFRVRILDQVVPTPAESRLKVSGAKDRFEVSTPWAVYPVAWRDAWGLWVEQPRRPAAKTAGFQDDRDLDDMLDALKQPGKQTKSGRASSGVAAVAAAPAREPPMGDAGLPACWQVAPVFNRQAEVRAWTGPVRAVVTLFDPGPAASGGTRSWIARQTLSFPPWPNRCAADVVARPAAAAPESPSFSFGGMRVNSLDYAWDLVMSQKHAPPENAPVPLRLVNSRRPFVLEPYQRATFSYEWAQVVSTSGWAAVFIDQVNSRPAAVVADWGSGARCLGNTVAFADNGPMVNSLAPLVRFKRLDPGQEVRLRFVWAFDWQGKPPPGKEEYRRLTAVRTILPLEAQLRPKPDPARLRALREGEVLIVTPDAGLAERGPLWDRLAAALDATWRPAGRALHFVNTISDGNPPPGLTTIVVGERGANPLLDQWNESIRFFNGSPDTDRSALVFLDPDPGQGAVLVVAGREETDTAAAVEELLSALGPAPAPPDLVLSAHDWADRMPWPWSGRRPVPGPLVCAAFRNGHADFLLLARANTAIADWRLEAPVGAQVRSVLWRFNDGLVPVCDAALPGLPPSLARDDLAAVWIRLPVPADASPGTREDKAVFAWSGGRREIALRTEILGPVLPEKLPFGFYPMGLHREMIAPYLGLDDPEAYCAALPGLLRTAGEFGVNTYGLDLAGLTLARDPAGAWVVQGEAFRKELAAARSAGVVDQFFIRTLARFEKGDLADWEAKAQALRRFFQDCGFSNNLVCIHGDEIADYETWLGHAELYAMAGVRMSVAINGYGVYNKHLAVGTMGFWIPLYNFYLSRWGKPISDDDPVHFSKAFRDARHAAGEPIWPYVCGPGPYAWSARPRSQARFLVLDTFLKGADGLSYYGGTAWSHGLDPAFRNKEKADLFGKDHTFTTLFYPDPAAAGLLPSLRAGSFRIGFEDAAAIAALRARAAERRPEIEAALEQAFSGLTLNAGQAEFDAFRRELDRLWRGLGP